MIYEATVKKKKRRKKVAYDNLDSTCVQNQVVGRELYRPAINQIHDFINLDKKKKNSRHIQANSLFV